MAFAAKRDPTKSNERMQILERQICIDKSAAVDGK